MNSTRNNIAISCAGSLAFRIRLYAIGLRLCYNLIIIRLLQTMVGGEVSR